MVGSRKSIHLNNNLIFFWPERCLKCIVVVLVLYWGHPSHWWTIFTVIRHFKNISCFHIGLNLVAFLIIVLSYGSMFYNIQRTGTQTTKYTNHIKKELTIAKRFFSIVITDSLCWIPIFILKILSLMEVEIPGKCLTGQFKVFRAIDFFFQGWVWNWVKAESFCSFFFYSSCSFI